MALEFTTSDKEVASNGIKMLVYGDSGIGKTVLCATMPNPVMISAESGPLSLQRSNLEKLYPQMPFVCPVPIIKIRDVNGLNDAYQWLLQSQEARQFQSVAIDSITEIGEVVLNNAKRQVKDPRQAYGELIEKMETVIRAYRDLPGRHVYMSAKVEPIKDEMSGIVKYGPSMPGAKLGPKLPYFFDFVFKMASNKDAQGKDFRYLQTYSDLQTTAKDRSGKLDPMEYPHLGYVISKAIN